MPKRLKKKAAKKTGRRTQTDPNLSAVDMVERSLRAHETPAPVPVSAQISAYMSALGKKGGKASGAKRMTNLTREERREIAAKGARKMWEKRRKAASDGHL